MKRAILWALVLLLAARMMAEERSFFPEGERLFREDKPREAAVVLEKAVLEAGVDERAWLYLALCYQQLGRFDDGVAVLRKGLPQAREYRHLFYFDMGNLFLLQGKALFAEEMYGEALKIEGGYAPAYLNRANARLTLKDYKGAQADYSLYLVLDPSSNQRAAIESLLSKLGAALTAEEERAAAAEAQRRAEAAAKQALLDEISSSLKAAAEETTNLSVGTGEVQTYDDELPLQN